MNKTLRYYNVACWNTSDTAHWQEAKDREAAIEIHKTEMSDCAAGFRSGVYMSHREMHGWQECWSKGTPATPTGTWIIPMTEKKGSQSALFVTYTGTCDSTSAIRQQLSFGIADFGLGIKPSIGGQFLQQSAQLE